MRIDPSGAAPFAGITQTVVAAALIFQWVAKPEASKRQLLNGKGNVDARPNDGTSLIEPTVAAVVGTSTANTVPEMIEPRAPRFIFFTGNVNTI